MNMIRIVSCILFCFSMTAYANDNDKDNYNKAQQVMDEYRGDRKTLAKADLLLKSITPDSKNSKYLLVGYGRLSYKSGYINNNEFQNGSLERSINYFKKAISSYPEFYDAYFYAAYPYMFSGNYKEAKHMASKANNLMPDSARTDLLFGEIAQKEKKYTESIRYGKSAISKQPTTKVMVDAYSLLKVAYINLKKYDLAEQAYLSIIEIDPESAWAKGNYSAFLSRYMKDYDKAILQGELALKQLNYGMGRYVTSRAYYKKAGILHWTDKKYKEAVPYYLRAVQLNPSHANAYYGLGVTHYRIGNLNKSKSKIMEAHEYILMAIKLNPKHSQAIKFREHTEGLLKHLNQNK